MIELHAGNGLAGLAELGGADLILTDPPYPASVGRGSRRMQRGGGVGKRDLGFDALTEPMRTEAARAFARHARRWVVVFCMLEDVGHWRFSLELAGLQWVRTGIWYKPNAAPQFDGRGPAAAHEAIAICHVPGRRRWNGNGRRAHWEYCRPVAKKGEKLHPCEKSVGLLRELISLFSDPGDCVVDPFAGRGSTIEAAYSESRDGIGWELDPSMAARATERLAAITAPRSRVAPPGVSAAAALKQAARF